MGVEIDGVNNKIDLDDDKDTSISANVDDTLVVEVGGVDEMTMSSSGIVINENSNDRDFRIESNGNTGMLFVDGGNDRVGIGISSPEGVLHIHGGDSGSSYSADSADRLIIENNDSLRIDMRTGATNSAGIMFSDGTRNRGELSYSHNSDGMSLSTAGSTRMVIGSNGNIGVGSTDTTHGFGITVADTRVTSGVCLDVHHNKTDTTFSGIVARFQSARNTTNETYEFIRCAISGIANKLFVHDSGDVDNANNSYGGISDERVKQDIVDANSQWNDIKSLKVKNFRKKANVRDFGDDALTEIGVIAQDLEASGMNGLVKECQPDPSHVYSDSSFGTVWTEDDDEVKNGTETLGEVKEVKAKVKTVKYSVLYMKAIKALQEAQTRIETLETKVAALEGN